MEIEYFDCLDDHLVTDVILNMMKEGDYQGVVNLMCTSRRLSQIGQMLLTDKYHRVITQPPSVISQPSLLFLVVESREWIDTLGLHHSNEETYQIYEPNYGDQICRFGGVSLVCQQWLDPQGKIHRDGDAPAVIARQGSVENKYWYRHGIRHRRLDRPSVVNADGSQAWYQRGQLHRDGDQPAVILSDGSQEWYRHGSLHRDGDQPAVIRPIRSRSWLGLMHLYYDQSDNVENTGGQKWYQHGQLHRDHDRPATIDSNGTQEWWFHGKRHREEDQPAVIWFDGRKEWFRHGVKYEPLSQNQVRS